MNGDRLPTASAIVLALSLAGPASASVTEADRDILEAFYEAANGDDWHRDDGWLEPGSDPCDWYGVTCSGSRILALALPANNLSGTLDTGIFDVVSGSLDLSDNTLEGALERLPGSPSEVDLSDNRLSGEFPHEISQPIDGSGNWYLDLSGNDLEGEIPPDWPPPRWLSLADNDLEGMPESLLDPGWLPGGARFLDVSDNRFSGELAVTMMDALFAEHNGASRWGGGLNLCWNDWVIPEDAEFRQWLRSRHVAGEWENCLSRERRPVDATLSGSWFDPQRGGEGIALQVLENGQVLNYVFTFDEDGRQQWLLGLHAAAETSVSWRELVRTRGRFGSGLLQEVDDAMEVRGSFRVDRLGRDRILAERVYIDETSNLCLAVYPPPLACFGNSLSDRLEYHRLTQLAGTSCDKQSEYQHYAGAWYNPERAGEGFVIEVLPDDRAVVYWFTHTPDGSGDQAWMIGEGVFGSFDTLVDDPLSDQPEARIEIETVFQPVGAVFGDGFDPAEIELVDWGSLVVDFHSERTGRVAWNSNLEGYGAGDYPIERLARPLLAECE